MISRKIITIKDSEEFFNSSVNTLKDSMGKCVVSLNEETVSFDEIAISMLSMSTLRKDKEYEVTQPKISRKFRDFLSMIIDTKSDIKPIYDLIFKNKKIHIKIDIENDTIKCYLFNFEKLIETERELNRFNNVIEAGNPVFKACTWWIDYDMTPGYFYQTPSGPTLLGIEVKEDLIYNTSKFQEVRNRAGKKSPFYFESIEAEKLAYETARNNKTDYFGGRTPAFTFDNEEIWVESYGKVLLRYPDGRPRFVVAIDIYLSDLFEKSNQLALINNMIDSGLINSEVSVWYYQKNLQEGRYYFTESHHKLMKSDSRITNDNISSVLDMKFAKIIEHSPQLEKYVVKWRTTHNSIFSEGLDKYSLVIPNHEDKDHPQWVEIRGTVLERDEDGEVKLFIGINIDVTERVSRNLELERLRLENDRLQIAEKLAIKAGNVLVWYQDMNISKSNDYIFGNEIFTSKLGIKRNNEGLVSLRDMRETIVRDDLESIRMAKQFLRVIFDIIKGKQNSIHKLLVKHEHRISKEVMYFEHTIEIEDRFDDGSVKLIGGFMTDVTENVLKQQRISYLANYDILSDVHNRNHFEIFIKSNDFPSSYSVLLFDLDGLKLINDAFGHLEGDKAIKLVADFLKKVYDKAILLARIGGDEFIVINEDINSESITKDANVLEAVLEEYNINSHIEINVSKGGFVVEESNVEFDKAFTHAENLMYRRKLNSRSSRKSKALESIMETLNAKTEETKEHSDRISEYAVKIIEYMGMNRASEVEDLRLLSKVHDIGKITVPDNILNKPGKLNVDEFEIVKKHCEAGYKIIKNITDSDFVSEGVLSHHERWDGKGYPQGLSGEDIPFFARIISIVDSYDAMTSDRIYQKQKTQSEAIEELIRCSGTQFDSDLVKIFVKACFDYDM